MTEDRLCDLMLLFVDVDMSVDRHKVLERFDATGHQRIGTNVSLCELHTLS